MMTFLKKMKPKFWDHKDVTAGIHKHMFDFRKIWTEAIFVISLFAIVPLTFLTFVDYRLTKRAMENEIMWRTSRFVSNTRRTVSFFLHERRFALDFIIHDNTYDDLNDPIRLNTILENLKKGLSGISDLGLIDFEGRQTAYAGDYPVEGKDYGDQPWFKEVSEQGMYVSDVFLGYRNEPHLVIAVKHKLPGKAFFILRASVDMNRLREMLSQLEMSSLGDAFIINHEGVVQTPSHEHGGVLDKIALAVPEYSDKTNTYKVMGKDGKEVLVGYAYIKEAPFILMIIKDMNELLAPFHMSRANLMVFLIASVTVILVVIFIMSTHLVGNIYLADQRRVMALHEVEYNNKMASIGRLAAGVAHEINNPLAIIDTKAGLIQDLFTYKQEYVNDPKLLELIGAILNAVDRCAKITRRLLRFARQTDVNVQMVNLEEIIHEVLGFLEKEAAYKSIEIVLSIDSEIPLFETDRGKLQQILLNLFNNAFAAMDDGGRLDIRTRSIDKNHVDVMIGDSGCGIPEEDLEQVFEPFFTTRSKQGGTGLGLSITYGLVQELGGTITVSSSVGKGTQFEFRLPLKQVKKIEINGMKGDSDAHTAC